MPDDEPPKQMAGYLRTSVGLISSAAAVLLLVITTFLMEVVRSFPRYSPDDYLVAGGWVGFIYFAAIFVTCLRRFPASWLYPCGSVLHFVVAPVSLGLVGWFSNSLPSSDRWHWLQLIVPWLPFVAGWYLMAHSTRRSTR